MAILRSWFVVVLVGTAACGGKAPPRPGPTNVVAAPAPPPEGKEVAEGVLVSFVPKSSTIALEGTLRDSSLNEELAGATLVVTSPRLAGELTTLTNERGHFAFGDLDDGAYTVTIYYSDFTRDFTVEVQHGLTTRLAIDWKQDVAPKLDMTGVSMSGASYTSALDALTHGAIDAAADLAQKELAQNTTSRAHAVLALALYGKAVEGLEKEVEGVMHGSNLSQLANALATLETDIDVVQAQLVEAAKDPQFSLELCVACITADGALGLPPGFLDVERDRAGKPLPEGDLRRRPTIRFDVGDIAWARAMLSFQQALVNIALAYDWSWADPIISGNEPKDGDRITIAVVAPARIARARELVLAGLKLSDDARAAYLAETDDDREWVPNPTQTSYSAPLPVDTKLYATWAEVVGDVRALVNGKAGISLPAVWKLLELGKGAPPGFVDVSAMFTSPSPIVIEIGALDRIEREKNVKRVSKLTTQVIKDLIGKGYKLKMPASRLTDRLLELRRDVLKAGGDAYEDKLKYVLWLN